MKINFVSKIYAYVNQSKSPEEYDYNIYNIPLDNIDDYHIHKFIGLGRYSSVFEGFKGNEKIIIKTLKPIKQIKINREVMILQKLKNHDYITKLISVVVDHEFTNYSLIFEYLPHESLKSLYKKLSFEEIKSYMKMILEGLDYAHSKGIMHRDIKPQNIIINRPKKQLKIIDWGLSEFYIPEKTYSCSVATKYYKAPELLMNFGTYDYSIDVWSVGCILIELITNRSVFFRGKDNEEMLHIIINYLGKKSLKCFIEKYKLKQYQGYLKGYYPLERIDLSDQIVNEHCLNLIEKILVYDPQERLSAKECLENCFFGVSE